MCIVETQAQNYYYAVMVGDTVELSVTNANGSIQWQQADDTLSVWTNIAGATTSPYTHLTESSGTGFKYYRAEVTNPATCVSVWYSDTIKHRIITSTTELQIGDFYGGGFVFYNDNGSGLIAAPSDYGTLLQWGCSSQLMTGADGLIIGTGNQNTIDIELGCTTPNTAADVCANLVLNSYSDWFLPSKEELHAMYSNLKINGIGNFGIGEYWSSSEFGLGTAWLEGFEFGTQYDFGKGNTFNVRAIRSFSPPPSVQDRLMGGETPKQIYDSGVQIDSLWGKTYQGGLIFYLNITTGAGLVAATADLDSAQWGCWGTEITGTLGDIGVGLTNTNAIVAFHDGLINYYGDPTQCDNENDGSVAAKLCADYTDGTYNDWALPTNTDLNLMRANLHMRGFGNFISSDSYWSSTELDRKIAYYYIFTGTMGSQDKFIVSHVRPVRAF
ncbi:MAG: hypothetical protein A2W98_02255 [Bacteroidetes bacterium GWF2_33_38]|nr:MAG: hypothetical protein A2W98_02255 [Bacteroidetes bacterium GWF2_33_38]OFY73809.1 MAG: hypothetical protein A2265_00855 [Bacteroidetes bacterium RIFOXYA12_FULL_33_9]OFY89414.1 MAG: hypothetical protein A2236_14085 [Bacteroidetes bacterium RIFOXYA2_FULL_33_7]